MKVDFMFSAALIFALQAATPVEDVRRLPDPAALSDQELSCEMMALERAEVLEDRAAALGVQQQIATNQADYARQGASSPVGAAIERLGEKIIERSAEQARRYAEIALTLEAAHNAFCSGASRLEDR